MSLHRKYDITSTLLCPIFNVDPIGSILFMDLSMLGKLYNMQFVCDFAKARNLYACIHQQYTSVDYCVVFEETKNHIMKCELFTHFTTTRIQFAISTDFDVICKYFCFDSTRCTTIEGKCCRCHSLLLITAVPSVLCRQINVFSLQNAP